MASVFETLNAINVNEHTEKKQGLTYLSWAWAWGELKNRYPRSYYTVYENASGLIYHTDGKTAWVKTGVTVVDGDFEQEHIEYLPVMDHRNKSIPIANITSFDVNKAIQRSLTKAVARHGLGLYIYAGEDLPDDGSEPIEPKQATGNVKITRYDRMPEQTEEYVCDSCGQIIEAFQLENGKMMSPAQLVAKSQKDYKGKYCPDCMMRIRKNTADGND